MGEDVGVVIEHEVFKSEFSILERSQVVVASLIPPRRACPGRMAYAPAF